MKPTQNIVEPRNGDRAMTLSEIPSPARTKASLSLELGKLIFLFYPACIGLFSLATKRANWKSVT